MRGNGDVFTPNLPPQRRLAWFDVEQWRLTGFGESHRQRDRQRDRQIERQTERQTDRQTEYKEVGKRRPETKI